MDIVLFCQKKYFYGIASVKTNDPVKFILFYNFGTAGKDAAFFIARGINATCRMI